MIAMNLMGSMVFMSLIPRRIRLLLNLHPFVASTRIGDCLDNAHVANAFFKIRARPNASARFHGSEKIFFTAPFAFKLRRKIDVVQGAIAHLVRLHNIGAKIVSEAAGAAVNFQPVAGSERIDAAELKDAFGAIFKLAKDGQQIGNDHVVALPDWIDNFSTREDAGDVSEPALQDLDVNPQRENIQPTKLDPLPPMRWRFRIQITARETLQSYVMRLSDVILGQELFHQQISTHAHGGRTKHRDPFRLTPGCR